MTYSIYPKYQLPFLQFVIECLTVLTYIASLLPTAYLSLYFITIPLVISSLVISHIQESELYRFSLLNALVSFLLLYFAFNVAYDSDYRTINLVFTSLLAAIGAALSIFSLTTIGRDVSKHYKLNQKFHGASLDKTKVATIKPIFSTKNAKALKKNKGSSVHTILDSFFRS